MRGLEILREFGIDPDSLPVPTTGPRQKIHIKNKPQWWYLRNNNPTYKCTCPHCGHKVWPNERCSNCGKPLDYSLIQKEFIEGEKARDLDLARRLAKKWGYKLVKE